VTRGETGEDGPVRRDTGMTLLATRLEGEPGRRLRVARLGTGPPLVLLHGYPDNLQIWCRAAPLLSRAHQVLAFDWPGMGESDEREGEADPQGLARRLQELLDGWGLQRVSLLAMDMGAPPALVFAALRPERVAAVVVLNSLLFGDEETSREIRVMRRLALNGLALRFAPRLVFGRVVRTSLPAGDGLDPGLSGDLWASFARRGVRRYLARLCAGYERALPELPGLYARMRCPTLALWGERDHHFPPAHGRRLAQLVPGARLEVIPRAGHWMALSHPEAVAERVLAFPSRSAGAPWG